MRKNLIKKISGKYTGIGSLPYYHVGRAVDFVFNFFPDIPYWPQLPKRATQENMYIQFTEGIPCLNFDEKTNKLYFWLEDTEFVQHECERFYYDYLAYNLERFAISETYASGFHTFIKYINEKRNNKLVALKTQITGPISMGLALTDTNGKPIIYNKPIHDIVVKTLALKIAWQIEELRKITNRDTPIIVFIDEPYMSAYGSAFFQISPQEIKEKINEVITEIHKNENCFAGVHCCANTDWSIIFSTEIDILSFDAYGYFDRILLYTEGLKRFLDEDKILAIGLVPSTKEIKKETAESILTRLFHIIESFKKKDITNQQLKQIIFTPSCGLGNLPEELLEPAVKLLMIISSEYLKNIKTL